MTNQLEPGSYSTGTLRDEDLLDMFSTIKEVTECDECQINVRRGWHALNMARILEESPCECDYCQRVNAPDAYREDLSLTLHDLFDHVGERHVAEGYMFSSHPGDGADFGVWEIDPWVAQDDRLSDQADNDLKERQA